MIGRYICSNNKDIKLYMESSTLNSVNSLISFGRMAQPERILIHRYKIQYKVYSSLYLCFNGNTMFITFHTIYIMSKRIVVIDMANV